MNLQALLQHYYASFTSLHRHQLSTEQWSALNAMLGCRTGQYGKVHLACPSCQWQDEALQSCGHRTCTQCQHALAEQWIDKQSQKLLPVDYFMVTFTIPQALRGLFKAHQQPCYTALFDACQQTLKQFAANDPKLCGDLGFTGILHTHSRQLAYHPHIHFIVPAGAFDSKHNTWRRKTGKYLFRQGNLAAVFRATLLKALAAHFAYLPKGIPKDWIVDCEAVGNGLPALKYLSKYLYRGVISDKQIIKDDGEHVTFRYQQSGSKAWKTRTVTGAYFIYLLLQHVLPKGFRRIRDFGFLHGNAKRTLRKIQLYLRMALPLLPPLKRKHYLCSRCKHPTHIVAFSKPANKDPTNYRKLRPDE